MYEKDRLILLQKLMASSEPLSSSALAFTLNVSVKTLLKYINQLKDELMEDVYKRQDNNNDPQFEPRRSFQPG